MPCLLVQKLHAAWSIKQGSFAFAKEHLCQLHVGFFCKKQWHCCAVHGSAIGPLWAVWRDTSAPCPWGHRIPWSTSASGPPAIPLVIRTWPLQMAPVRTPTPIDRLHQALPVHQWPGPVCCLCMCCTASCHRCHAGPSALHCQLPPLSCGPVSLGTTCTQHMHMGMLCRLQF